MYRSNCPLTVLWTTELCPRSSGDCDKLCSPVRNTTKKSSPLGGPTLTGCPISLDDIIEFTMVTFGSVSWLLEIISLAIARGTYSVPIIPAILHNNRIKRTGDSSTAHRHEQARVGRWRRSVDIASVYPRDQAGINARVSTMQTQSPVRHSRTLMLSHDDSLLDRENHNHVQEAGISFNDYPDTLRSGPRFAVLHPSSPQTLTMAVC